MQHSPLPGETNLSILLQSMNPVLQEGEYVFCTLPNPGIATVLEAVGFFREAEGMTVILRKEQADKANLPYAFVAAWITLTVHSSLAAVGLTAAFAKALAEENISCNVVAAYYHDHIFVPYEDKDKAMKVLRSLANSQ